MLGQEEFRSYFQKAEKRLARAIFAARLAGNRDRLDYYREALGAIGESRRMGEWETLRTLCSPVRNERPVQRSKLRRTLVRVRFLLASNVLVENREDLRRETSLEKIGAAWKLLKRFRLRRLSKLLHGAGWREDILRISIRDLGDFRLRIRKGLLLVAAAILPARERS